MAADDEEYILYIDNMVEENDLVSFYVNDNQKVIFRAEKNDYNNKWVICYIDEKGTNYKPTEIKIFPFPNSFPLEEKANDKKEIDIVFKNNSIKVLHGHFDIVNNCKVDINSIEILDNNCIIKSSSENIVEEESTSTSTTTTTTTTTITTSTTSAKTSSKDNSSPTSKNSDDDEGINLSKFSLMLIIVTSLAIGGLFGCFATSVIKKHNKRQKNNEQESTEDINEPAEIAETAESADDNEKKCGFFKHKKNKRKQKSQKERFITKGKSTNHTDIMRFNPSNLGEEKTDNKEEISKKKSTKKPEAINGNSQIFYDKFCKKLNQVHKGEIEPDETEWCSICPVTISNSYNLNFSGQEKPKFRIGNRNDDYIIVDGQYLCLNFYDFRKNTFAAYNDISLLTNCFSVQKDGYGIAPKGQRIKEITPGLVKKINDNEYMLLCKGEINVET